MTDFSKFTSEDFDAKDWINDVFKNYESSNEKEQVASNMVMKLQLLIQEVVKSLEDTSQQIVHTLPKLNREIAVMQQEASMLKKKMQTVKRDVQKVEEDTSSAMDGLLLIDLAKCRTLEVERALREVDNWAMLIRDIEDVFQTGDADAISDRLDKMEQSLNVMGSKVRDFATRKDYLERLKDQFVIAISPSLVSALNARNVDAVQYFYKMFVRLNRRHDFEKYCRKVIKIEIAKKWHETVANEELKNSDAVLDCFYDQLLAMWFEEVKWLSSIMPNPERLLCISMQQSLESLRDPKIDELISDRLQQCDSKTTVAPMEIVLRCKSAALNVGKTFLRQFSNPLDARELLMEVLAPFSRQLGQNLQQYEQSWMLEQLNSFGLDTAKGIADIVDKLKDSCDFVMKETTLSMDRCRSFCGPFSLPALCKALQAFFDNYFSIISRHIDHTSSVFNRLDESNKLDRYNHIFKLAEFAGNIRLHCDTLKSIHDTILDDLKSLMAKLSNRSIIDSENLSIDLDELFLEAMSKNEQILSKCTEFLQNSEYFTTFLDTKVSLLIDQVNSLAMNRLAAPILATLREIPNNKVWNAQRLNDGILDENLPSFSVSPQEYITTAGQYVMTLAHHLEPYLTETNNAMKAFVGHLSANAVSDGDSSINEHVVRYWLGCLTQTLMTSYLQALLEIRRMSETGSRQLRTDIDYLKNVLEDLGVNLTVELLIFCRLLDKAPEKPADLDLAAQEIWQRLNSAILEMKKGR